MKWLIDFVTNPFLLTSLSGWGVAQVLKVIINAVVYKKYDWRRLFGDGGMPSGHSATVSSLACITGLVYGLSSFEFAFTMILAIIVCHDAMGVRMETGKQAVILNGGVEGNTASYVNDSNPDIIYAWHMKEDQGILAMKWANGKEYQVNCQIGR